MATDQQNLSLPTAGQADWDSDLNGNFSIIEFGYRARGQAGEDVNTGDILTVGSDGFALKFDPNSEDIYPHLMTLSALSSGDESNFVAFGSVRSIDVFTPVIPGHPVYVSAASPGMVVSSYSGANRNIGRAHYSDGFIFDSNGVPQFPEKLVEIASVDLVVASVHKFSMDFGLSGQNRIVHMVGASGDLVDLKFYSSSEQLTSELLYSTISGGVTTIGSFIDQAGWPYFNTDPSTVNGMIYGTLELMAAASVTSDSVGITVTMDRNK
jgi:hypothetical protein